eukprot:8358745-Lingulodinium_polyedra.AAC.1
MACQDSELRIRATRRRSQRPLVGRQGRRGPAPGGLSLAGRQAAECRLPASLAGERAPAQLRGSPVEVPARAQPGVVGLRVAESQAAKSARTDSAKNPRPPRPARPPPAAAGPP